MKCKILLSFLIAALVATCAATVEADDADLTLEYNLNTLTWDLYAEVIDTGGGAEGGFGLSAVLMLIDNIDFGTMGDAVNMAAGIGAIFPGGNPPVLQTAGGTLEILYGQDISDPPSVVGGVGVGGRALIADGTFASAATPPAFGDDDSGFTSESLFLNTFPGPFGGSIHPDNNNLVATDVTVPAIPEDLNMDGFVDGLDLGILLINWNQSVAPSQGELSGTPPVDGLDLGILLIAWNPPPLSAATGVPEPSSIALSGAFIGLAIAVTARSRRVG